MLQVARVRKVSWMLSRRFQRTYSCFIPWYHGMARSTTPAGSAESGAVGISTAGGSGGDFLGTQASAVLVVVVGTVDIDRLRTPAGRPRRPTPSTPPRAAVPAG